MTEEQMRSSVHCLYIISITKTREGTNTDKTLGGNPWTILQIIIACAFTVELKSYPVKVFATQLRCPCDNPSGFMVDKLKLNRFFVVKVFLPTRQNSLYFSGAGKFCLAHGLRQLTHDVESDVRTINFRSDVIFTPPRKNTE